MKFGVALATLGLVDYGSAFVPSSNVRHTFVGQAVTQAATTPSSTRHTRQVLKAVAAAPAVQTETLTKVSLEHYTCFIKLCTVLPLIS